jgi:aminoglycoside phosphotransferase (APT) family kinase protein
MSQDGCQREKNNTMTDDANSLDIAALGLFLRQAAPDIGGIVDLKKFNTGQSNPTYQLITRTGKYVLRTKPPGKLLKSAHQVDREYRVMQALQDTNVPVPKMFFFCPDERSPIGRMFFIMEFLDGRIFWDPAIPEVETKAERGAIYQAMNTALANLHDVDVKAIGLEGFGKPGSYFKRQTGRWTKQYCASQTGDIKAMDMLIDWLEKNQPEDDGQVSIVHGDYRIDNMIFAGDSPVIMGLLDWELSTLGHPLADIAYQCMQWRLPNEGKMRGLAGLDRSALGIPSEEEYVARYCAQRGINEINDWPFYLAFSFFRLAAILQGVVKRAEDGNASNAERARQLASAVPLLAGAAIQIIEQEA